MDGLVVRAADVAAGQCSVVPRQQDDGVPEACAAHRAGEGAEGVRPGARLAVGAGGAVHEDDVGQTQGQGRQAGGGGALHGLDGDLAPVAVVLWMGHPPDPVSLPNGRGRGAHGAQRQRHPAPAHDGPGVAHEGERAARVRGVPAPRQALPEVPEHLRSTDRDASGAQGGGVWRQAMVLVCLLLVAPIGGGGGGGTLVGGWGGAGKSNCEKLQENCGKMR